MVFRNLYDFVSSTPNAKECAFNIASELECAGFVELDEKKKWEKPNKNVKGVYVRRGDSIVALRLHEKIKGFVGVLTHSDSPCFKIKTNPEIKQNGYVKLNVEPYGGAIYYSWFDKPLSIYGTMVCKDEQLKNLRVNVDTKQEYQVFIPSQAIHINREVNSSNNINPQKDMLPVCDIGNEDVFLKKIKELTQVRGDILAYDLSLYNPEPVRKVNLGDSKVVMGPRLDNLASVYAALMTFAETEEEANKDYSQVLVAFNSEEIGSATHDGADGNFLTSVLERICNLYEIDKYEAFADSMFLSIDAAHAIHPNAPEKSDPTNIVKFGGGVVIKHNINYANDFELEAHVKRICVKSKIKMQDFYSRSDMRCGATLGNISMSHIGIRTLDIGIPMLAMHSAVETIDIEDTYQLSNLLYYYFQ